MNDFKEFDELLKGFVEGDLTDEEQYHFEEILKTDSASRQRYLEYAAVESMLSSHRVKMEHAESAPTKNKLKISTERAEKVKRNVSSKRRNNGAFLILAASVFLALSLAYYMKFVRETAPDPITAKQPEKAPEKIAESLAVIESLSGDTTLVFNGKNSQAINGMAVNSGTEILTSGNSQILIKCNEGSSFLVSPNSHLILLKEFGQIKIDLKKGFFKADVNKQDFHKPLLVLTSKATMTVLGTVLRVSMSEREALLIVDEGRVEMKNSRNQRVVVHADESAREVDGNKLEVRDLKPFKVKSLKIISAIYGAGDKWVDLTPRVQMRAGNSRLIPTGDFKSLAGDPNYGIVKSLKVKYEINGKVGTTEISEYTQPVIDPTFFTTEIILPEL